MGTLREFQKIAEEKCSMHLYFVMCTVRAEKWSKYHLHIVSICDGFLRDGLLHDVILTWTIFSHFLDYYTSQFAPLDFITS